MTWTAPDVIRPSAALAADERTTLDGYLAYYRGSLLHKCAGLSGEQLAERAVPPSNLSLLGLLRHMAKVERIWFRRRFAGQPVDSPYDPALGKDADFEDLRPARAEEDYARFVEECRLADAAAASASLDDTFTHLDSLYSLRMIYVHMIAEYARHVGHADLLRERVDGVTGA
jgi:uncharacterized damage-inducible protein DinB